MQPAYFVLQKNYSSSTPPCQEEFSLFPTSVSPCRSGPDRHFSQISARFPSLSLHPVEKLVYFLCCTQGMPRYRGSPVGDRRSLTSTVSAPLGRKPEYLAAAGITSALRWRVWAVPLAGWRALSHRERAFFLCREEAMARLEHYIDVGQKKFYVDSTWKVGRFAGTTCRNACWDRKNWRRSTRCA